MRDLVKIYPFERLEIETKMLAMYSLQRTCGRRLKAQIGRHDITILNITKVENVKESCLDCYVDYEFWGGK
ncbi:hypothetical protein KA005_78210 [bacterium]|nr:hypothetical protein [bacterium]